MSGNILKVMVSNDIERNHFDKACNGSLIAAFKIADLILIKLCLKQIIPIMMMT